MRYQRDKFEEGEPLPPMEIAFQPRVQEILPRPIVHPSRRILRWHDVVKAVEWRREEGEA